MEPTASESIHRPLGFGAAFTRQFGLLWTSRRPLLLGVALLGLLVLGGEPWADDPKTRLLTLWPIWLIVIGPVWAIAVFYNEGPSQRLYHWSLPVGRLQHTAARLAAGVVWMWILFGVLIGAGAVMGAMDGDLWQFGEIKAAGWVNFFTGPLLGYLAVSVLTVASDYPLRWSFGIMFGFPLLMSTLQAWLGLDEVVETLLKPLGSLDWGLFPVMLGGLGGSVAELQHTLAVMADPQYVSRGGISVEYWWTATPLWILLFVAIVLAVASRHPDKFLRLRRPG